MQAPVHPFRHGFSLVELSIVLVILGLLVGGILAGQSLIRAAEIRGVATDFARYTTAIHAFKDKYFALPGDMANATSIWGGADGNITSTNACYSVVSTGPATCNGNADGRITVGLSYSNEPFRFWQHLNNAGLIEGQFSGTNDGANSWATSARNVPQGRMPGTLWFLWNWGAPQSGHNSYFNGDYGNRMSIGGSMNNAEPSGAAMSPAEQWNLDIKMDDGLPAKGKLWSLFPLCTTAVDATSLSATYDLARTTKSCYPLFPKAF